MASYVKNMTGSEKENVPLIMLNNFHRDKHCLNIKFKCLKKGFSQKINEKQQNDGYK